MRRRAFSFARRCRPFLFLRWRFILFFPFSNSVSFFPILKRSASFAFSSLKRNKKPKKQQQYNPIMAVCKNEIECEKKRNQREAVLRFLAIFLAPQKQKMMITFLAPSDRHWCLVFASRFLVSFVEPTHRHTRTPIKTQMKQLEKKTN